MDGITAKREKRRFERVRARNLVSFAQLSTTLRRDPSHGLGRTLDVCAGGARMETNRALAVGERLQVEIALGSRIVRADATVVHVCSAREEMVEAGLSFDRIPAPDREILTAIGC